jgi:hypothetical protein
VTSAAETNLLGTRTADLSLAGNKLKFELHPWRTNTFEIL